MIGRETLVAQKTQHGRQWPVSPERCPPGNWLVLTHCKCQRRSQTQPILLTSSLRRNRSGAREGLLKAAWFPLAPTRRGLCAYFWLGGKINQSWYSNPWTAMPLLEAWHKPLCINIKGFFQTDGRGKSHRTVCTKWWHWHKLLTYIPLTMMTVRRSWGWKVRMGFTVYSRYRFEIFTKRI